VKILSRYRNAYHLLVLLGVLVFAVADENMLYVVMAALAIVASRVLTGGPNPLFVPRWCLNVVVVLVTVGMAMNWSGDPEDAIPTISRYLVWLQLIKLFEPARPRDQALTIVMSMMLVVGSSLTSVSAEFGLALLLYIPTLIVTLMLFQLYLGQVDEQGRARHVVVTGKRPGAQLRWLALGSVVLIFGLSVPVFVAMPRGIGSDSGALARFAGRPKGNAQTGFRDHVQLGDSGLISESTRIVLEMKVESESDPAMAQGKHYLRGAVLDIYNADQGRWQQAGHGRSARRDMSLGGNESGYRSVDRGESLGEVRGGTAAQITQHITLHAESSPTLFNIWRPQKITIDSDRRVRVWFDAYHASDHGPRQRLPALHGRVVALQRGFGTALQRSGVDPPAGRRPPSAVAAGRLGRDDGLAVRDPWPRQHEPGRLQQVHAALDEVVARAPGPGLGREPLRRDARAGAGRAHPR